MFPDPIILSLSVLNAIAIVSSFYILKRSSVCKTDRNNTILIFTAFIVLTVPLVFIRFFGISIAIGESVYTTTYFAGSFVYLFNLIYLEKFSSTKLDKRKTGWKMFFFYFVLVNVTTLVPLISGNLPIKVAY